MAVVAVVAVAFKPPSFVAESSSLTSDAVSSFNGIDEAFRDDVFGDLDLDLDLDRDRERAIGDRDCLSPSLPTSSD